METFSLSHTTRTYPRLPYHAMKEDVLGTQYTLSLVFVGRDRAKQLNQAHRNKSYTPNVLSFPIDRTRGEIYITPEVAKREARSFNMSVRGYIGYLFIHGLLHLKGYDHGATMDKAEARLISKFALT